MPTIHVDGVPIDVARLLAIEAAAETWRVTLNALIAARNGSRLCCFEEEALDAAKTALLAALNVRPTKGITIMTEPTPESIMQFFSFTHLPPDLQLVSQPFCVLADIIASKLPRNAERTVALRKLLESKDAAVRAFLAK